MLGTPERGLAPARTRGAVACGRILGMTSADFSFDPNPSAQMSDEEITAAGAQAVRDIADVPAVEIIASAAVHLMSAAAVKVGLAEDTPEVKAEELKDLDEARKLITALAGLVTAGSTEIGDHHARPLRDGLRSLQLAFREASVVPDAPGQGPGEKYTGPVR